MTDNELHGMLIRMDKDHETAKRIGRLLVAEIRKLKSQLHDALLNENPFPTPPTSSIGR